jgi:hypothetical protein
MVLDYCNRLSMLEGGNKRALLTEATDFKLGF